MHRKFASIQNPEKYGYAYDSEAFDSNAEVDWHMRMFETYGDGLCQHSGDWPITTHFMPDYLASLATAMMNDPELVERVIFNFCQMPSAKTIAFCASVKWKVMRRTPNREPKPRPEFRLSRLFLTRFDNFGFGCTIKPFAKNASETSHGRITECQPTWTVTLGASPHGTSSVP